MIHLVRSSHSGMNFYEEAKIWAFISLQWLLYVLNLSAARGKGVGGGGDGGDPYESETIRLHSLQAMTYSVDNVPSLKAVKLVVVGFGWAALA